MNAAGKYSMKRLVLMLTGILLIGMCVAFYRMSGFGVDPFSCMNLVLYPVSNCTVSAGYFVRL